MYSSHDSFIYLAKGWRRRRAFKTWRPYGFMPVFGTGDFSNSARRRFLLAPSTPQRPYRLVPEWLACLEHVLHAFLGFRPPAEAQKRFPLQVQQILLGNLLFPSQPAAA